VPPAPPAVEAAQPASAAQPQSHPTASRPVAVDWDAIIANAPRRDDGSARVSTPDPLKRDPFSQPSQTKRNPIDPLVDLARMEDGGANDPMRERSIDPLALFAEDPHAPSPLSDPRPTALIDAPVLHDVHPATELLAPGPPPAGPSQADHGHEIASQFSPPLPVAKSLSESPVGVEPACAQPPTCSRPLATAAVIAPFIEDARSDASPEHASEMPLLGANGDTAMLEQLFHAFLEGAGVPDVAGQQPVSIDTMRRIGRLLRAFTDGAMELLASRAMLKREVRAEITMIVDEENNPFKILPSGRAVLMQMFGARMPGFLSPEAAVSDALGDLHLHQLGMVAGMRAALLMVLQRFDPGALDIKTPHDGTLSERLLPGGRHLRLWRELRRLHDETTSAVEDDFHAVFGHAFQQAYDKEMDRLREARHA
jgi:FHA domain-containing protein